MNKRFLLSLSGIFSILIYFFIVFGLIFGFWFSDPIKYIPKMDTKIEQAISIDALLDNSRSEDQDEGGNPLEGTGIKDVFSSIDNELSSKDEIPDNRDEKVKNLEMNKRRQKAFEELQNSIQNFNAKLNTIKNKIIDIQSQSPKPDTSDGIYDKWFSEVYKILYSKWQISFYQNASVSVLLTITDNGDFSYRILRYSNYDDYNKSVENLLESLKNQRFPPYPKGKLVNIEVNFKTEGK
ncbi:energy transducer TonB [Helicobacter sp. 13S00477-4]|uniref:energy transducer TonB n=1 Tax=Helicobacter sp. 13S00477-4 TaxID=1905759 RepID=UPI000BA77D0A|nr:energy transducer TonB [Helicobacter sp. 13S00477-4]PAF52726.1 hypothetical protein BKH44_00650 [Helicobacter sp. 13S00477-4]